MILETNNQFYYVYYADVDLIPESLQENIIRVDARATFFSKGIYYPVLKLQAGLKPLHIDHYIHNITDEDRTALALLGISLNHIEVSFFEDSTGKLFLSYDADLHNKDDIPCDIGDDSV